MDLDQNHSSTRRDSSKLQPPASVPKEINLYDELLTFSDLSPEERLSQAERASKQIEPTVQEEAVRQGVIAEQAASAPGEEVSEIEVKDADSQDTTAPAADSFPAFGKSGPLGSLNPEFPYTGSLSPGICLSCGAESGAEDLFCATCGAFVEEVGSGRSSNPKCPGCGSVVSADEVFCPGCGAVLTSS